MGGPAEHILHHFGTTSKDPTAKHSEILQSRYLFRLLLRLDFPSVEQCRNPLAIYLARHSLLIPNTFLVKDLSSVPNYSADVYLWLNYIIFESLVTTSEDVEDVFRSALLHLENPEHKKRMWLEYV